MHVVLSNPDPSTLENLSEFICGDDTDKYPMYRSSYYLTKFFRDINIDVEHDGTTRKLWVLSGLKSLSDYDLNRITLRLVDIKIYKGDKKDWNKAIDSMNNILFCEDLRLLIKGKDVFIVSSSDTVSEDFKEGGSVVTNNFYESQIHSGIGDNAQKISTKPEKDWYEKPLGIITLTVVGGLILAGIVYFLGWN